MTKQLDDLQRWELDLRLGQLINVGLMKRKDAETAKLKTGKERKREAEALAEVNMIRQRLGFRFDRVGSQARPGDDA